VPVGADRLHARGLRIQLDCIEKTLTSFRRRCVR
jgi:hypothetical protein